MPLIEVISTTRLDDAYDDDDYDEHDAAPSWSEAERDERHSATPVQEEGEGRRRRGGGEETSESVRATATSRCELGGGATGRSASAATERRRAEEAVRRSLESCRRAASAAAVDAPGGGNRSLTLLSERLVDLEARLLDLRAASAVALTAETSESVEHGEDNDGGGGGGGGEAGPTSLPPDPYDVASALIRLPLPAQQQTAQVVEEAAREAVAGLRDRLDRCVDLSAGPGVAFAAALDCLRDAAAAGSASTAAAAARAVDGSSTDGLKVVSSGASSLDLAETDNDDNAYAADAKVGKSAVLTAVRTARRLLLTLPNGSDGDVGDGREEDEEGTASVVVSSSPPLLRLVDDYCSAGISASSTSSAPSSTLGRRGRGDSSSNAASPSNASDPNGELNDHAASAATAAATDDLARQSMLLPMLLSSACHAVQLNHLPGWSVRTRFCPRLVECALTASAAAARAANAALPTCCAETTTTTATTTTSTTSTSIGDAATSGSESTPAALAYLRSLLGRMVRHGGSDLAALGVRRYWKRLHCGGGGDSDRSRGGGDRSDSGQCCAITMTTTTTTTTTTTEKKTLFKNIVSDAIRAVPSPRDRSTLLRSLVRLCASELNAEQIETVGRTMRARSKKRSESGSSEEEEEGRIWSYEPMAFLRDSCLPTLLGNESARDAFFRLVVMSPPASVSSSSLSVMHGTATVMGCAVSTRAEADDRSMIVVRIVVSLFALCVVHDEEEGTDTDDAEDAGVGAGDDDSEGDDSEDEDGYYPGNGPALPRYLRDASQTWAEPVFLSRTDVRRQLCITEFILCSIPYCLDGGTIDDGLQQSTVMNLVRGVTMRLESSLNEVRRQGMVVAEALAPMLGQTLRFPELDGEREDGADDGRQAKESEGDTDEGDSTDTKIKKDDGANSSNDDDSIWDDDDLEPYDLDDDEEDLRGTRRPRYLRDCLALLLTPENDKEAFDNTEAALREIASLVQTEPYDLPDLAGPLTKELLFMENKFDMDKFVHLRFDGLCALLVHEPMAVSNLLAAEIFGSVSLGIRMDILSLYERAAEELCGSAALRKDRDARLGRLRKGANEQPRVSGKRRLVQGKNDAAKDIELYASRTAGLMESKTRRWGRGRRREEERPVIVMNRFGPIAPMMFYPLVTGFARTKDDTSIWGGPNGARLMASFLVALARLVESSGNHPGTVVLASDLFDLSWPFRSAESPEVRMAVLVAIATCISYLPVEFFMRNLYEEENLASFLRQTVMDDSDATCRQVAAVIAKNLASADMLSLPGSGIESDFCLIEKATHKI